MALFRVVLEACLGPSSCFTGAADSSFVDTFVLVLMPGLAELRKARLEVSAPDGGRVDFDIVHLIIPVEEVAKFPRSAWEASPLLSTRSARGQEQCLW